MSPVGSRLAFVASSLHRAPEIWLAKGDGSEARGVTGVNAATERLPLAAPEFFRVPSFDGLEIECALLHPPNAPTGSRLPLVTLIHGGPTGAWLNETQTGMGNLTRFLVARGYAVLLPNIRGSTGYGHAFVEANRADWGGRDFKDVLACVDAVIARGVADADRLAIAGRSYGGYMAAWAVTQTQRFKASIVGAGLSDLAAEFGTEDSPAYDEWFFGTPYENLAAYTRCSPITFVKNVRTPTLILHGERDEVDPLGQGQQFYRVLKRYLPGKCEFAIYPRAGHGLREEKHLVDYLERSAAWLDKHLMTAP